MGHLDTNNQPGKPHVVVKGMETPFLFDGLKVCQNIRKPTAEGLVTSLEVEITAPMLHNLSGETNLQPQRRGVKKARSNIPLKRMEKQIGVGSGRHDQSHVGQHNSTCYIH